MRTFTVLGLDLHVCWPICKSLLSPTCLFYFFAVSSPLTNVRNTEKLNEKELELGLSGTRQSWHHEFADSAYVFVGEWILFDYFLISSFFVLF